jgi:RNA polymerase sigma factor (sigma-70 family)
MGDMQEGLRLAMCQYGRLLHKVAYNILRNYAVAQDAVSMAWYKFSCAVCSEQFATFEAEQLIPFLCLITRREAFTLYRREQKQRLKVCRKRDALFEEPRRKIDTPDDIIERNERDQLIRDALEQLQPHIRTALRLRYFFDEEVMQGGAALSNIESERYEQLAAATGRKAATLRSHVNRGLKRLEKLLNQRGINSY